MAEVKMPTVPQTATQTTPTTQTEKSKYQSVVAQGSVTKVKAPLFKTLMHRMVDAGVDVFTASIKPGIYGLLAASAHALINNLFSGGTTPTNANNGYYGGVNSSNFINYNQINKLNSPQANIGAPGRRATYEYDLLRYADANTAQTVLNNMRGIIETYGFVSVGDMYELSGQSTIYTDFNWGWENLSAAKIGGDQYNGYRIDLPAVKHHN